jgi:hypothetical protein
MTGEHIEIVIGVQNRDFGSNGVGGDEAGEQTAQIAEVPFVAGSGQYFHSDRVARGDLPGEQLINPDAHRASRIAQELHPGRGVHEDHPAPPARISSRSASHPEPRSRRAASMPRLSAATVRNAKLTASRFVARWYRCMTTAHASLSRSMLVRAIHQRCTFTGFAHGTAHGIGSNAPHRSSNWRSGPNSPLLVAMIISPSVISTVPPASTHSKRPAERSQGLSPHS